MSPEMKQKTEEYELNEAEVVFLDRYSKRMLSQMPKSIKEMLKGDKEHLRYHVKNFLEDLLISMETECGMEKIATSDKLDKFARYLVDVMHPRVNTSLLLL